MNHQSPKLEELAPEVPGRKEPPVCLSIAGLDPSGGAGVLADVRAFAAFGCFPAAAVTSVTFQNTEGVFGAESQSAESVRRQIDPVFDDFAVGAVKTGMLPDAEVIRSVSNVLRERKVEKLVVDPVVRSTSGFDLIDDRALESLVESLFPVATLVTPNLPEAERIAGFDIKTRSDIVEAGNAMVEKGAPAVLIKGGHIPEKRAPESTGEIRIADREAVDFLFIEGGVVEVRAPFYHTDATHGTGCVLSSSIAACLARGDDLKSAVTKAKMFVNKAIASAPLIGKGHAPINIDRDLLREAD